MPSPKAPKAIPANLTAGIGLVGSTAASSGINTDPIAAPEPMFSRISSGEVSLTIVSTIPSGPMRALRSLAEPSFSARGVSTVAAARCSGLLAKVSLSNLSLTALSLRIATVTAPGMAGSGWIATAVEAAWIVNGVISAC